MGDHSKRSSGRGGDYDSPPKRMRHDEGRGGDQGQGQGKDPSSVAAVLKGLSQVIR